uniref:Transferrin-like domain-containing protein n=1 Tax=Octopus bimaculoides TaxID=37653 RepID=A0A0L8GW35_OCTBM
MTMTIIVNNNNNNNNNNNDSNDDADNDDDDDDNNNNDGDDGNNNNNNDNNNYNDDNNKKYACIPGALDKKYNPEGTSISLCEACGAEGFRKCQRNSEEQYYGANGAFRCLVESSGDVAFVPRNRRSDDYELLCKGDGRANIDDWEKCQLGKVPANAIVTGSYKDNSTIQNYWNLLNYGQEFFLSVTDGDFHMFDSGTYYNDLLFIDSAVRLMQLPEEKQNYQTYLGPNFISQIKALKQYTCMPIDGNPTQRLSPSLLLATLSFVFFFSSLL